jgi:hypothetical protein
MKHHNSHCFTTLCFVVVPTLSIFYCRMGESPFSRHSNVNHFSSPIGRISCFSAEILRKIVSFSLVLFHQFKSSAKIYDSLCMRRRPRIPYEKATGKVGMTFRAVVWVDQTRTHSTVFSSNTLLLSSYTTTTNRRSVSRLLLR